MITPTPSLARLRLAGISLIFVALLIGVAAWGGTPDGAMRPWFYLGVLILTAVMGGFGLLSWHLLWRPLPPGHRQPTLDLPPIARRRLLSILLGFTGVSLVIGGLWDEVWHRSYGIPFGEDLLWRPHMLIYASILTTAVLAVGGLRAMARHGRGTWQQRFRARPLYGLLVLVGAFMFFALPVDPIWHIIYGDDISGWSLPHILVMVAFVLVMLLATAIDVSTQPLRTWRMGPRVTADWPVLLLCAFSLNMALQALTTDWDSPGAAVLLRPTWLLPSVIVAVAVFFGALINQTTRTIGAATTLGLAALAVRLFLMQVFPHPEISSAAWLTALTPLAALDLWSVWRLRRHGRPPEWVTVGLAAAVGMAAVGLPMIGRFYTVPALTADTLPGILVAMALAAAGAAWCGQLLGGYLATANKQGDAPHATTDARLRWIPAAAFVITAVAIALLIATARPPV